MKKNLLFIIALLSFSILFPTLSLFLAGYRLNFEKKKIEQTGAIYIKTIPKNTKVTIDKKIKKETSPISGTVFIKNLLPKEYQVVIKKEGFYPWTKKLKVREQKVESAVVVLFPQNISLSEITKNINDFLFLEDGNLLTLEIENENWQVKKFPGEILVSSEMFPKKTEFVSFAILDNNSKLSIKVKEKEKEKSFVFDLKEKKLSELSEEENIFLKEKIGNEEFVLTEDGFLLKNKKRINKEPIIIKKEKKYSIKIFRDFIFLFEIGKENDSNVYIFDKEKESFEKIFEKIINFSLSPLKDKILFFSDKEIFIFFLSDTFFEIEKRKGEILLLVRISEKIKGVSWLNNKYLAFLSSGRIRIAEVDDREKINIWDITDSFSLSDEKIEKFYFDLKKRNFYLLTSNYRLLTGKIFP